MDGGLTVGHLRCEYLVDPLGIGTAEPRLSWVLSSDRRGARQSAYRILVASEQAALDGEDPDLWDSGTVASSDTAHIAYAGASLEAYHRCLWRVRAWDERRRPSDWSPIATFEMGHDPEDWTGQWITLGPPMHVSEDLRPAPHLRREFEVPKAVARARIYATALGLYRLHLNGTPVGDARFTPGWTDYRKRVQYETYDVTDLIRAGSRNAVGVVVADGWYAGRVGIHGPAYYGDWPEALLELRLTYEDGEVEVIVTDTSWRGAFGPYLLADLMWGETYDALSELGAWTQPGYDDGAWEPARPGRGTGGRLVARCAEAVRVIEELPALGRTEPEPGRYVFDLGQNMVGVVRLRVRGPVGTRVTIRHAEMLEADGTPHTANLRWAKATDTYILRGDGEEIYEPAFTFHGFRYVELTGYPGEPHQDAVTGVVLASATPETGSFRCSSELVNRLQQNIRWSQRGNFLEVPTDCPQRDERLGWMGDAQVFVRTACFNADVAAFFTKWMADVTDAQSPAGAFPDVAPLIEATGHPTMDLAAGDPAWGDAGVIVPWTIHRWYGDTRILETNLEAMKRWVAWIHEANPDLLWRERTGYGYGDWVSIDERTPLEVVSTAFFAHSADLVARSALVLGRASEAEEYARLHDRIREAFVAAFVDDDGRVHGDTQTAYVLALRFDLLPDGRRAQAVSHLVARLRERAWRLATGFVGVAHLLPALTDAGRLDVAYRLLEQQARPSWLYPVVNGATTIWERWDGWTHEGGFHDPFMNSFNHYAFGSVGEWLYAVVGGIELDRDRPGWEHVVIRPRPGGSITSAETTYTSIRGPISCAWRRSEDAVDLDVEIPANVTATVHVPAPEEWMVTEGGRPAAEAEGVTPAGSAFEVGSGRYRFRAAPA